ncbi:MAG: hypothetical protein ACRDBX_08045 [Erysipelotrichaceae bacterium]
MKIYNTKHLNNNARYQQALIYGILATVAMSVVYALIVNLLRSTSAVLFLLNGFVISAVIKKYGKGVGPKFGMLGLVLTLVSIVLSQLFFYYGFAILLRPDLLISGTFRVIGSLISLNNPLNFAMNMLFIYFAAQYAYSNSSVL